jgi:hypothetical protein
LPRGYLDERPSWWTRGNLERRTLDPAYATTGHKAQGLTREWALVRVTGAEDANWLRVQASRARQETRLYAVISPEARTPELDVPDHPAHSVAEQLTAGLRRDGSQQLATDTSNWLDLARMSTLQLRAERDRLARLVREAPPTANAPGAAGAAHPAAPGQHPGQLPIGTPTALGPEPRHADLEQRRHHRAARWSGPASATSTCERRRQRAPATDSVCGWRPVPGRQQRIAGQRSTHMAASAHLCAVGPRQGIGSGSLAG